MHALAKAFGLLVDAITDDWHHADDGRPFTRLEVIDAMFDLVNPPRHLNLPTDFGFIHPQMHREKHLLGFWTM